MARLPDTHKKERILRFLQQFFDAHDYAPRYADMKSGAGLNTTCIIGSYLDQLKEEGLVTFEEGKRDTLRLTARGRSWPNRPERRVAAYVSKAARINAAAAGRTLQLPVVGRTFAGQTTPIPSTDFQTFDEFTTIEVSEDVLPPRGRLEQFFVLEVSGESMIEAGIFDGDYVICRKAETARNGEMVVALLTDTSETTLKYFYKEADHIRLQPANKDMQPIRVENTASLIIQGVVVSVVRCVPGAE